MDVIFLKILNMSIIAGYIVVAAVALRILFKKAPKWIYCLLWSMVGLRLILPFSIKSMFSIIPKKEIIPADILQTYVPVINNNISTFAASKTPASAVTGINEIIHVISIVWIIGMVLLMFYGIISYIMLRQKVEKAELIKNNIYCSKKITSPFILGIIRPRIYLPYGMDEKNIPHVIAHEQAHIRRKDHWIKPFSFILLTVYWFNPLIWVAFILLCGDIELACDEAVIRKLGNKQKKPYSEALLSCSLKRKRIAACPLAFGEVAVRGRIRNVLNYKKPTFWIVIIAVAVSIVVAVVFLTNPKDDLSEITFPEGTYVFKECIYINGLSSFYPFDGTGELYEITENGLTIRNIERDEIVIEVTTNNLTASYFTNEEWSELFMFNMGIIDILSIDYSSRYMWEISDEFRVYEMEGKVWLMHLRGKNGVWSIYELKPEDSESQSLDSGKSKSESNIYIPEYLEPLDKVISHAIISNNENRFSIGEISTSAYTLLKKEDGEKQLTIYAMVMFMRFSYTDGRLVETGGIHSPVVLTLDKGDNGGYGLYEYWIPEDGTGYASSIKEKFPEEISSELLNTQKYVKTHSTTCYESAIVQSGMDAKAHIDRLFGIICALSYMSNPYAYIQEHNDEYMELLKYGTYTLQYCFELFREDGQTGLKGYIMALACREILMDSSYNLDLDVDYTNGQLWYDEFQTILDPLQL